VVLIVIVGPAAGEAYARNAIALSVGTEYMPAHRLDLAAMALTRADLPEGYVQDVFEQEGCTPGDRTSLVLQQDLRDGGRPE
jgi:hypothetical protein